MQEKLSQILEEAKKQLSEVSSVQDAEEIRIKVLGKKGQLTEISQSAFSLSTQLTDVYTVLSESEWNALPIGDDNDGLDGAVIHYDTPAMLNLGDMDNSGKVDSTDVFYLMLYIAQNGAGIPTVWEDIIG